jgi:hypothetical protein
VTGPPASERIDLTTTGNRWEPSIRLDGPAGEEQLAVRALIVE